MQFLGGKIFRAEEQAASADRDALKSRTSAAKARLAAARELVQSSQEEADDWKRKYDIAVREAKAALEKAALVQERADRTRQSREDTIIKEIKKQAANIEHAEQRLATLSFELKAAESKIASYELQISGIKELNEKLDAANATVQSYETEANMLEQEKNISLSLRGLMKCKKAMAMERLTHIERQIDQLQREKNELESLGTSETDANAKVRLLEAQRVARGEANRRAEALSHLISIQLQATQAARADITSVRLNESVLDAKLKSA
ncbi:Laminin subunit beta-2 [Bienertia sinuspersici]